MIEVENSNDKAPYFTPETQRAEVTEDTPIGTVFATLKATDPDSTNLEALNFAISEPITAIDRNGQRVNDSKSFKVRENIFNLTFVSKAPFIRISSRFIVHRDYFTVYVQYIRAVHFLVKIQTQIFGVNS